MLLSELGRKCASEPNGIFRLSILIALILDEDYAPVLSRLADTQRGRLADAIETARTLVWNGPLGAFETPPFDTATVEAARFAAKRCTDHGLTAVAGGGDTVAALNQAGVCEDFTFVSTAGGAFLEWLEGKPLPGIEALKD